MLSPRNPCGDCPTCQKFLHVEQGLHLASLDTFSLHFWVLWVQYEEQDPTSYMTIANDPGIR
jgi:hypothetical protein